MCQSLQVTLNLIFEYIMQYQTQSATAEQQLCAKQHRTSRLGGPDEGKAKERKKARTQITRLAARTKQGSKMLIFVILDNSKLHCTSCLFQPPAGQPRNAIRERDTNPNQCIGRQLFHLTLKPILGRMRQEYVNSFLGPIIGKQAPPPSTNNRYFVIKLWV